MDKTLVFIRSENKQVFDGSVVGAPVKLSGDAKATSTPNAFSIRKGFIEVGALPELQQSQAFTLEATVTPIAIGPGRQNIMESQSPPVAFFINPQGFLVGSINTPAGWVGLQSSKPLVAGKTASVRFSRDESGKMNLEMDGVNVGTSVVAGNMTPAGTNSFKVGTWVDGNAYQFAGAISNIQIRKGAFTSSVWEKRIANAKSLEKTIKTKIGSTAIVKVFPGLDESRSRLQHVKDIMNAAGVQKLSDLSTLRITVPTTMTRGKILIASSKNSASGIDWSQVATSFSALNASQKKTEIAKFLPNRNSAATFKNANSQAATTGNGGITNFVHAATHVSAVAAVNSASLAIARSTYINNPSIQALKPTFSISNIINLQSAQLSVFNRDETIKILESKNPVDWPALSVQAKPILIKTIPVNTSVIIAGVLDLTDTTLIVEPDVEKLYIIAEKVICGPNAKISWRKRGGTTPNMADNPDLNGRSWSGIQTKPDSRDGLDGEDGRNGAPGINGAAGYNAPALEMWVKDLSNMPNIDLNGEDGIKGGKGQRGGRGGNGGNGQGGRKTTFLWETWCSTDPGDGGHGGNGGRGGNGGNGGRGGHGAGIMIGVLDGTLATTVTNNAFRLKNQGGQKGRGGDGGFGGLGGFAGRSGNGEVCTSAHDGRNGAQGQPGSVGADASYAGSDGLIQFFQFSEDAWEELLTRPWITEINPTDVFPGNAITIRGSRFSNTDRVVIDSVSVVPVINADESISVTVPGNSTGGTKSIFLRRIDGTESNRIPIRVKPQLATISTALLPATVVTLTGQAFLGGASVLINGEAIPATVSGATSLRFTMPGTGGAGSSGGSVSVQVRNPDGLLSNSRTATKPRILEIPFNFAEHSLPFNNFKDGVPSWGTFEDTFGTAEVWHELLDPLFGHPVLTAAYYGFYSYFLLGEDRGGLATGFCTSLSSLVADKLWKGENDAHLQSKATWHKFLTGVHGKLLSRESLLRFHDQGRDGNARVEKTYREIERIFMTGCDRNLAPLLFFIPSGEVWDSGYFDKLSSSHCILPYRFVYPEGHAGPQLSADTSTTISDPHNVELFCWDCNHSVEPDANAGLSRTNCRVRFRREGGQIRFDYLDGGSNVKFRSEDGITLGMMTNGDYLLSDHDLPFSGPFGLTSFIIDFLLSPADLEITDENGLRAGTFANQIFSEIPDSHPCYLLKGAYLLPVNKSYTKRIVGNGNGKYTYNSIMPDGTTIAIENVATQPGHTDVLMVNADASQVRFAPHVEKNFTVTFSKLVGNQMRSLALSGVGGGPATEIDITVAPDLSLFRLGNRSGLKTVNVKAFTIQKNVNTPVNKELTGINLQTNADLVLSVPNWNQLNISADVIAF